MDNVLTSLEQTLNREILRYAVSRAMFCPSCETLLDVRDAVLYCPRDDSNNDRAEVMCGACNDRMRERATGLDDAALFARFEVTDGRV